MEELSESILQLLRDDPEMRGALADVDRALIRAALERSPLERLQVATAHLKALRGFKRVPSEGS
jgi:hypothetical protein